MTHKWKVYARDFENPPGHASLPTNRILDYHFVNELNTDFRINLLCNGGLEIRVDGQLVIEPIAGNCIQLSEEKL